MGTVDEAGRVASGTVEALKSQPLALALVIVNVLFLIGGAWTAHDFFQRLDTAASRKDKLVSDLMARCVERQPPP